MTMEGTTRILDLTVDEFMGILADREERIKEELISMMTERKHVIGIKALAEEYGVSPRTMQRIVSSGRLDTAITGYKNTIKVDLQKAFLLVPPRKNQ